MLRASKITAPRWDGMDPIVCSFSIQPETAGTPDHNLRVRSCTLLGICEKQLVDPSRLGFCEELRRRFVGDQHIDPPSSKGRQNRAVLSSATSHANHPARSTKVRQL